MTEHGGDRVARRRPARRRGPRGAAQGRPDATRAGQGPVADRARARRERGRRRRCRAAAHDLPHARRLRVRAEGARRGQPDPGAADHAAEQDLGGKDVLGIEITENVTANDGKPAFFNMGVHHAREWPAGELTMEWALRADQRLQDRRRRARPTSSSNSRNLVVPIVNPDGFEARAPPALPAGGGRDETRRRHRLHRRGARRRRVPAQELPRRRHPRPRPARPRSAWPRTASTRTATTASSGAARARTPTRSTQTYRGPAPFSEPESRNVQWLVSAQPGDVADHQPHDRRPRAARARPGRGRRSGRREPRLQGARRRDGQAQRLLQPEGLRALRHDRHDRGLELQRDRRLRLHVRALLRRARTTRPATATSRPSTRATSDDGQGVGRHQRAGRPRQRPGPDRLRRQGQPRGVLPRRRERDQRGAPLDPRGHGARRHARCG